MSIRKYEPKQNPIKAEASPWTEAFECAVENTFDATAANHSQNAAHAEPAHAASEARSAQDQQMHEEPIFNALSASYGN